MNDDNFAFKVLDCAEQVLASKGDEEKKLAVLMELERMINFARPALKEGVNEEQIRAYAGREETLRRNIIDWAHTLTLESQAAAKEELLNRGPAYFSSPVILGIAGALPPGFGQAPAASAGNKKGILNRFFK